MIIPVPFHKTIIADGKPCRFAGGRTADMFLLPLFVSPHTGFDDVKVGAVLLPAKPNNASFQYLQL